LRVRIEIHAFCLNFLRVKKVEIMEIYFQMQVA